MTEAEKKLEGGNGAETPLYNKYYLQVQHLPTKKSVYFKAFLTQFEDQYTSDWNTEQIFGRMDPVRTFRGTQRIISLGWDVVAASLDEAKDNLSTCSEFLSMLYPSYEGGPQNVDAPSAEQSAQTTTGSANTSTQAAAEGDVTSARQTGAPTVGGNAATIQSAPLFRVKFANLIQNTGISSSPTADINAGLIGSIDGLTYAPDLEQGFFDPPEEGNPLYPQTIKLSFGFYVAHDHPLGWSGNDLRAGTVFPYAGKKKGS